MLTVTAANDYAGGTTLSAGTLAVANSAALGSGGVFVNGGILRTAGAPKTINIGGNYTQAAGGILLLGLGGNNVGQYDRLSIAGSASLGGTLRVESRNGFQPALGDTFAVLDAAGGRSGQFAQLAQPDIALKLEAEYTPTAVTLVATQASFVQILAQMQQAPANGGGSKGPGFTAPAITPTQFAVAGALDSALGDTRAAKLIAFLDKLPLGALPGAFEEIAPEELASIFNLGVSLAGVQNTNLQRRMDDLRSGSNGFSAAGFAMSGSQPSYSGGFGLAGAAGPEGKLGKTIIAPAPDNRWGVFVTGLGEFVNVDSTDNARGYDLSTGGVTLGIDYRVSPGFAIGVNAGYARTSADLVNDGRVTVDGGKLGLYATLFCPSGFYLDAAVGTGVNSYATQRRGLQGRARGDTDGTEFNALLGTGYDCKKGALTIGPTATFQYTRVEIDGFRERGSLAPLEIARKSGESVRATFGLKASYELKFGRILVKPELRAAWQHEFGDRAYALDARFANGAGNTFTVDGPQIGRESLLLGAGVVVQFSERTSAYVYYDAQIGPHQLRQPQRQRRLPAGVLNVRHCAVESAVSHSNGHILSHFPK